MLLLGAEAEVAKEVDELAEVVLVEARQGEDLREGALEAGVLPLDGRHGLVE